MQGLAVASLTGLDTRTEKELPIYAQSLAFAPDGRLWMSHTGDGPRRWNPETDRLETWPLEVSGPLAIRPDGSPWQIGPTYTEPDRPDRIPLDPRPNPRFPLQLLDVERQTIIRTLPDPVEGGSRLLAWTLAPRARTRPRRFLIHRGSNISSSGTRTRASCSTGIACRTAPDSPALPGPGLAFSPDAGLLATWDGSGWVDLWSMADGQTVASFRVQNAVYCVAFGRNHWYTEAPRTTAERWMIAVGGTDGLITLWNPASRGTWQLLRAPGVETLALAFSGDGTLLASAGRPSPGYLWDVATGRRLVDFTRTTTRRLWPSAPTAHASRAVTGIRLRRTAPDVPGHGSSRSIRRSRDSSASRPPRFGHEGGLFPRWQACSRPIRRLVGGRLGPRQRATLRLCSVPRGQFNGNADLAFSPDARSLAVSAGNTATLWNLESGEPRRPGSPGAWPTRSPFPTPST